MNTKSLIVLVFFATAATVAVGVIARQRSNAIITSEREKHLQELAGFKAQVTSLESKLALVEKERDKWKAEAAEVHRLRGEISNLRKANGDLQKKSTVQQPSTTPAEAESAQNAPASISNYSELAQFAGGLRAKMRNGVPLTPEESAWLQQTKPELEKLESHPETFASFQASMIQSTAGITDPEKVEKIRQTIQKVYENAVNRGLTVQSRPQDDADWVQQRHQLDRRGTTAVQRILSEEERAAFDSSFLGVMGVDLGTGVDKTLYPPGFLGQTVVNP